MDAMLGIDGCGDRRLWRREDGEDSGGLNRRGVAARCLGSWHRWWSTSSAAVVEGEDGASGDEVLVYGFRRLVGRRCRWVSTWVSLFFFFLGGLWVVGSVIRGEHGWWSLVWEASLASLLAWG